MGAGEDAFMLGALRISASALLLLLLALGPSRPFSLFSLPLLLSTEGAPESSLPDSGVFFGGAVHRGTSQTTPVKLLSVKPPRAHLRHGLPDLSSARRPALMAPWFALGPSLCAPAARLAAEWSIVPSSLWSLLVCCTSHREVKERTYNRGFFLGPGFPLGLGIPSMPFADRLVPLFLGPSVGGPMPDGAGVPSAAGVAALESDAFSPLEVVGAATLAELVGELLTSLGSEGSFTKGVCSSIDSGKRSTRSCAGDTAKVTSRLGLPPDLRRPSAALPDGGIVTVQCVRCRGDGFLMLAARG